MKNKKVLFGIIIFLFAITGICSIQNVSAVGHTLSPRSYIGYSEYCNLGDTIDYEITSDIGVNVYIMTDNQIDLYLSGSELEPEYFLLRFLNMLYIHRSYLVDWIDGIYWVLITNPSYDNTANIDVIVYTIHGTPEPEKSIDITGCGYNSPNDYYVIWNSYGDIQSVNIILLDENYNWIYTIIQETANDGSYAWNFPKNSGLEEGIQYYLKITDSSDSDIYNTRSWYFYGTEGTYNYITTIIFNIILIIVIISLIASAIIIPVVIIRKRKKRISDEVITPAD